MLPPKSVDHSRTETTHLVLPGQANALGTIFGGVVMQWIDEIAAAAAMRHAGGPVVTVAVDALHFIEPIRVGELVVMRAQVNGVARTSMEIGVRVEVEDPRSGARRQTTKAYLSFVAVDQGGRPCPVPPLAVAGEDDRRRQEEAAARRAARLSTRRG